MAMHGSQLSSAQLSALLLSSRIAPVFTVLLVIIRLYVSKLCAADLPLRCSYSELKKFLGTRTTSKQSLQVRAVQLFHLTHPGAETQCTRRLCR